MLIKDTALHIIGIPFCILKKEGKNFHSGYTETIKRLYIRGHQAELRLIDYSKEYSTVKNKRCEKCKFFYNCRGIFKPYIRNFGWKEFQPVI